VYRQGDWSSDVCSSDLIQSLGCSPTSFFMVQY
jgi:hypothetical protein